MYTSIVFLPLLGFLIATFAGERIGARATELVTTGLMFVVAILSWIVFVHINLGDGHESVSMLGSWFKSGGLHVDWSLRVDSLTAVMLVVVTTVSSLVHLYSMGYMSDDPSKERFFGNLSFFTFAMLMLVTSDNLVQMFFGWEGVGLASYLLIGFWYEKPSAVAAAIKAFVVNRVGDFGFMLGIFLTFWLTGSVTFEAVFAAAPGIAGHKIEVFGGVWDAWTITCLLLFMGAMGKSAQFLLHTWLPDAMEGPTPVSALIHAATMVTAGVFMVARLSPLFELSPTALTVVTVVGATTAIFAATVGLVQNDIKRVIAYSTCSQLGYMFVALGVGGYAIGVFHLFTHAFFKALLFLGAGSVIHAVHHEQDMRNMGGLRTKIPFTFWMMVIGTLALTGFPMTSGYYSKDAIIEAAYAAGEHHPAAFYGFLMTILAAGLTSFYSWRLIFMTFFGSYHPHAVASADDEGDGDHAHADHGDLTPHESPPVMLVPLAVLAFGALFAGFIFKGDFIGHGYAEFWKGTLAQGPDNHIMHQMHEIPGFVSVLPTLMMLGGLAVAIFMYLVVPGSAQLLEQFFPRLYRFLLNKWYFDEIYDAIFVRPAFALGRFFWKVVDGEIIDGWGPNGVARGVIDTTNRVVRLQTGYLYHYAFAMLLGAAGFITWYLLGGGR